MLGKLKALFNRFPRVFWIVQTFEMMERAAYYTMVPIIVYHAIWNVGMDPKWGLMILAFMYPFQYGLPIFTGALAEKIGYKKQMIFAFTLLTIAYFFLFLAFNPVTMVLATMTVGIGIGSYKPLVSATVAKCTAAEDRNMAYGIYYWIVNFAAAVFPIFFVVGEAVGIIHPSGYRWVFFLGGLMVSVNIITAIFVFEEVPRSGKVKTVRDAVANIKVAFKDYKFVVMVILIGGFWAQYATLLFAIQIIIFGFHWAPAFITAMFLGIPNPLTIILLGPFITKFIEKVESMRVMLAGLMIYLIGFGVIAMSLQSWTGVIAGIVIASIGEFMVAPGYLAFISKLAPKDNVSAYIGCNFISYMIGLLGGTIIFSQIVNIVAVEMEMPYFFYGILLTFGLSLFIAAQLYYKSWGQDIIARAKKIREEEDGVKEEVKDENYKEPLIFRLFETKISVLIPLLLIPVVLFATFSMGTFHYIGPEEEEKKIPPTDWTTYELLTGSMSDSGLLSENTDYETVINISDPNVIKVTFTLTWTDEADATPLHNNAPDEFSIEVEPPTGMSKDTSVSTTGAVSVEFPFEPQNDPYYNGTYDYIVTIHCGNCGEQEPVGPNLIGVFERADNGNNWELSVEYEYYETKVN